MRRVKVVDKSTCKDNLLPDSKLLTWEKWILRRKKETENLGKKTGRPPADLVMNTLEKVRENQEQKTVLENAQIQKKVTIRNNVVWEEPARLAQICPCKPVYEAQRTKAELGRPRVIERIRVPNVIQETEKGLTGSSKKKSFLKLDADYIQYRIRRENELQNEIKKLDPHRPKFDELIVIGTKPGLDKESFCVPKIKLEYDSSINVREDSAVYAVQINKSIHFKNFCGAGLNYLRKMQKESTSNLQSSWTYYFNTPINKMGRAKLYLKNLGTVSLRYSWKKIIRSIEFKPENAHVPVFFFNKNDDILYPGEEKCISFTFLSKNANIYKENWELKFYNVSFLEARNGIFEIILNADVTENLEIIRRKVSKIRNSIEYKALKIMIKSLLEDIFTKATNVYHQIYPFKDLLLETEIFEMKNPQHFHHETKVAKLKQLYTEMKPGKWELSIKDWRLEMMKLEYDDRMNYYEILKQSNSDLLRPWKEVEDILQQKYAAVRVVLCRYVDKFYIEYSNIEIEYYGMSEIERKGEVSATYTNIRKQNLNPNEDNVSCVQSIFYFRMYGHICTMIETCAGIISGIDLNRQVSFDFC